MCVFVSAIVFSSQYAVSQAAASKQISNMQALHYYSSQFTSVGQHVVKQLQVVQKVHRQSVLALAKSQKVATNARRASSSSGKVIKSSGSVSLAYAPLKEGSHVFYAGQCTRYVASKKTIPWGGNAGQWLNNAAAEGYETSKAPKTGAILVTNESSTGHVAIVEEIKGDKMIVSEMNYAGWGKVTKREIPLNSNKIKGYITDARVAS